MRLIDADNLSKNIAKWCMGGDPQETEMVKLDEILFQVVEEIKKQPTAYDVEKVVEQLDERRKRRTGVLRFILGEAIEIVRKGGVE